MAAVFAGRAGADVVVVETNTTAGRKLLRTGRGRCNVTHAGDVREVLPAYDRFGRFLKHALYSFTPEDMIAFLAAGQLKCRVEADGLVFPDTDRATDVKNVLLAEAKKGSVRLLYGKRASRIVKVADAFAVEVGEDSIRAAAVIVATGGKSWPQTGSTGDGYKLAAALGHTVVLPKAAAVGLIAREGWLRKLQGVAVSDVRISCSIEGEKEAAARGPMMFTGKGLGGPAVFDLSRFVTDALAGGAGPLAAAIDLVPSMNQQALQKYFVDLAASHPKKEVSTVVCQLLPRALAMCILQLAAIDPEIWMGQLSKAKRGALLAMLKALPVTICSTCPIEEATVTRGGISREEIDPKTMQSKIVHGLFFAGEVIDVDGPCGGYNLQIAWSTGALAGTNAALAAAT
ncbi:MAG: NAD(P)/FAD-dependent oxidoreductase [Phycisphaerae bacterium]|nr:NAD(P)/FAD-dependent oxidoreductase [Phycisphaerae bacterium]